MKDLKTLLNLQENHFNFENCNEKGGKEFYIDYKNNYIGTLNLNNHTFVTYYKLKRNKIMKEMIEKKLILILKKSKIKIVNR